ncbi:MAG: amidohydrolase family protein [Saprospiraceae bacterium]|nr:amidohydrolase family protein [Saprospiraceae bacterium]
MKAIIITITIILLKCIIVFCQNAPYQIIELQNGYWFDGKGFTKRATTYILDGKFSSKATEKPDTLIDLAEKYVIPPFGEAHNHNIEQGSILGEDVVIQQYLRLGVFYLKNPNILPRLRDGIASKINTPESLDVIFATGGFTIFGGHPWAMMQRNIRLNPNFTIADGEGAFYNTIESEAELDAKWDKFLATKPDFVKTYLLYSEEFEQRKADTTYNGWKGLNPELLKVIVKKAHTSGLRVSCHIETGMDFHYAVLAGVDEINHMPGFRPQNGIPLSRYLIQEKDAVMAARKDITIVTTLERGVPNRNDYADSINRSIINLHKTNLKLLKNAGVTLAIGCDMYRGFTESEVNYLHYLQVFSNLELLKLWCENTPKAIFPKRKIATLKPGYEGSLLALEGNPSADFQNVKRISLRIKQGLVMKNE